MESKTNPSGKRKSTPNKELAKGHRCRPSNLSLNVHSSHQQISTPIPRPRRRNLYQRPPEASQASRFTTAINEAVLSPLNPHGGWAGRHYAGNHYRTVKVLLTFWAETDDPAFGAASAAHALAELFRRRYGFDVLVWLIPVMRPQQSLAAKLRQFARDVDARQRPGENLLIFWYGGSAREDEGGGAPLWFGESFGGPTINSQIVPQILGAGKSDVLTIYDSPHALHGHNVTGPGICEHLGASAHDDIIAGFVGESGSNDSGFRTPLSFTRTLIQILDNPDRAARGISVLDIHRKLVNRYRMAAATATGASVSESDEEKQLPTSKRNTFNGGDETYINRTQPFLPRALRQNPVYCHLSHCRPRSEGGPSSIVLAQLGPPATFLQPRQAPSPDPNGIGGERGENGDGDDGTAEVTVRLRLRPPRGRRGRRTVEGVDPRRAARGESAGLHTGQTK
ncbi:hypothetical protein PG996_006322 [Apiospora saccharicola]|uniref:Uncharacterized protein n=1 Tax=Apiospora saccharicola TaxID=335842 RepID=A0ABR1VNZ7_9PEZI